MYFDPLQHICSKFDFLEFGTVNSFHLAVATELYVSCTSRQFALLL